MVIFKYLQRKLNKGLIMYCRAFQGSIKSKDNLDDYDYGLYNGVESILSVMEYREPSFIFPTQVKMEEVKGVEIPGRTMVKGVRKCQNTNQ